MDLSGILGTALGLAALFWLLSTACSYFLELLNSLANIRGKALVGFTAEMLGAQLKSQRLDQKLFGWVGSFFGWLRNLAGTAPVGNRADHLGRLKGTNTALTHLLFGHSLIRTYAKPTWLIDDERTVPSYLPSRAFTTALFDVITRTFRSAILGQRFLWNRSQLPHPVKAIAYKALDDSEPIQPAMFQLDLEALLARDELVSTRQLIAALLDQTETGAGSVATAVLNVLQHGLPALAQEQFEARATALSSALSANEGSVATTQTYVATAFGIPDSPNEIAGRLVTLIGSGIPASATLGQLRSQVQTRLSPNARLIAAPALEEYLGKRLVEHALEVELGSNAATTVASWNRDLHDELLAEGTLSTASTAAKAIIARRDRNAATLSYAELKSAMESGLLPDNVTGALKPLVENASRDLDEARKAVEGWYDGVMDRATGWYKRRSMVLLGFIAFVPACAYELNSIEIAKELLSNPAKRAKAEQLADAIYADPSRFEKLADRSLRSAMLEDASTQLRSSNSLADITKDGKRERLYAEVRRALALEASDTSLTPVVATAAMLTARSIEPSNDKQWDSVLQVLVEICNGPTGFNETDKAQQLAACKADSTAAKWRALNEKVNSARALRKSEEDALTKAQGERPPSVANIAAAQKALDEARETYRKAETELDKLRTEFVTGWWKDPATASPSGLAAPLVSFLSNPNEESLTRIRAVIAAQNTDRKTLLAPYEKSTTFAERRAAAWKSSVWHYVGTYLSHLFGLLLTCLMVSLGAPFWYELIGRIVNVRGTGEEPVRRTPS